MPESPLFLRVSMLRGVPDEKLLDLLLTDLHKESVQFIKGGRNLLAGSARAWGLQFSELPGFIGIDPIFRESFLMAGGRSLLELNHLMNIFLIMKYGMKNISGDFVEFGAYRGGTSIFIANVARRLGLPGKIYALDTFEGMPATSSLADMHFANDFKDTSFDHFTSYVKERGLNNLVPVKGLFQETFPEIARATTNIALAHIDCDIYESVNYAISALPSCMREPGGYMIFDDPLHASCIGAMEAVEEMIQKQGLHAEQTYPHLVYRLPKLEAGYSECH